MRRFGKNGQLETVICNKCGKKMVVERGILREGGLMFDHTWDFFRKKTGRSIILIYARIVMTTG